MCDVGRRVENHKCEPCDVGKYNTEKHDASGEDTECKSIICDENEYVSGNQCVACPPGTYNAPGDLADGPATTCDAIICDENYIMYKTINVKNV